MKLGFHFPPDLASLIREMIRERDRNNSHISFGSPLRTREGSAVTDPTSLPAGETLDDRSGADNIEGQWVLGDISAPTHTFKHGLGATVISATTPNVGWLQFGQDTAGHLTYAGGAVNRDDITLAWSGATPAKVLVFFVVTGDW